MGFGFRIKSNMTVMRFVVHLLYFSTATSRALSLNTKNDRKISYFAGHRCLLVPARHPHDDSVTPLALMGGMAQTIESWEHHIPSLSKNRDLLIFECRGQGIPRDPQTSGEEVRGKNDDILYADVSLEYQAESLNEAIREAFGSQQVDIAGFSLGGRVAMATAVLYPSLIRRLHLTGVAAQREAYGQLMLWSWRDLLLLNNADDSLRPFAWSILLATYSPKFVAVRGPERIQTWVQHICNTNCRDGLLALLEQTEFQSDPAWYPLGMAHRMMHTKVHGRLVVGSLDQMATPSEVQQLSNALKWGDIAIIPDCGHAVPMQEARLWRNDLLHFLNKNDES
uniref:AB hydrolase-1 domain-containing protein n=1 Tax=Attheya septentrionalis TaxID=420275 RepID=A0A7S2U7U3_9STRA|mmetsp:Transcript_14131/g.25595  ORF Transcript_14131/g.25595 Transcript_14131/m.25595 type:complete len:338 (+) Transcript_14131:165-1178(+)